MSEPSTTANDAGSVPPPTLAAPGFFEDIWLELQPYLKHLIVDFCISAGLWIALYLFHLLTHLLEINSWTAKFIVTIHAFGTLLAFIAFGLLFTIDVLAIRKRKKATHDA